MLGIWSLSTPLSGTSFKDDSVLAQISFQFIFLTAILVAWLRLPSQNESIRNAYNGILFGFYFLIAWYVLTLCDLFFHETSLNAAYGYILFYFFISLVKFAADILILAATHRLVSARLYEELRKPILWVLAGEFQTILLLVMALFYLGSLIAHEVLWLNVADSNIINDVSLRKNKFEVAFFALQFVFTLFTLFGSIISAGVFSGRGYQNNSPNKFAIAATGFLWIRSFSELVNVTSRDNLVARYFLYGLCTFIFLLLIASVARDTTPEQMNSVLVQMEGECRRYILNVVADSFEAHGQAPVLAELFQNIRQNPSWALSTSTRHQLGNQATAVTAYIDKLEAKYGGLVPVDLARGIC